MLSNVFSNSSSACILVFSKSVNNVVILFAAQENVSSALVVLFAADWIASKASSFIANPLSSSELFST
jgi:hypothetical protein